MKSPHVHIFTAMLLNLTKSIWSPKWFSGKNCTTKFDARYLVSFSLLANFTVDGRGRDMDMLERNRRAENKDIRPLGLESKENRWNWAKFYQIKGLISSPDFGGDETKN